MDEWPWVTKAQAAELVGLKRARFDEAIKPKLKRGAIKGNTRSMRFDARAVVLAWFAQQSPREAEPKPAEDTELDRGRAIDNEHKNLRLMKELGKLVAIDDLQQGLAIFSGSLHEAGAILNKKYGPDAGEILNEQIQAGERGIANYFDRAEDERPAVAAGHDGGKQGKAAPDNAAVRRG